MRLGSCVVTGQLVVEILGPLDPQTEDVYFSFADAVRIEGNLPSYVVRDVPLSGWTQTSPSSGEYSVFTQPGRSHLDMNFGAHDEVAPAITVDASSSSGARPALGGTVDDPYAEIEVSVDGNAYDAVNNGDGTWTLAAGLIAPGLEDGVYDVSATATDPFGNIGTDDTTNELTVSIVTQIVAKHIFYNNSQADGNDPLPGPGDDNAIAAGKQVMAPGQTPGPVNYSGYLRGINGIMVDVESPENAPEPGDFSVRVSDPGAPGGWVSGPSPTVSVRPGEGVGGADRVTLIWADGAIIDRWIEVTVKSDANGGAVGLTDDDVFYFGNSIGDCDGDGAVGDGDYAVIVSELGQRGGIGTLSSDLDGDGRVGLRDFAIMRSNLGLEVQAPDVAPAPAAAPAPMIAPPGLVISVNQSTTPEPLTVPAAPADILEESAPAIESPAIPAEPTDLAPISIDPLDLPTPTDPPATTQTTELELADVLLDQESDISLDSALDADDLLADLLAESALVNIV